MLTQMYAFPGFQLIESEINNIIYQLDEDILYFFKFIKIFVFRHIIV